jgi:tetratricopeptide (TPR) repeat protein
MLVYLRFDQTRRAPLYGWALGLFLLAVFSKTVTATLPGGLLVIFWWQRGRLSWKRDVLPLLPFFLLGAGGGLITAWWELKINNCVGPEFQFTPLERLLIAGRAVWFHLWKLCWPTKLTFIYPRWHIDSAAAWQYVFPLGVAALTAALWSIRRWSRAPLAALLFFGGTLFPVLGFFNLYTFRYSLVANHYQYLASLGVIVLASAGVARLLEHRTLWRRPVECVVCLGLLASLGILTWRQSRMYTDITSLYQTTIDENPDCWMAHNNLGIQLAALGRVDDAIAHYQKALEIKPAYDSAHNNLGLALAGQGKIDEAITHYQQALQIKPAFAEAYNNLGLALARQGKIDEAITDYQQALQIKPAFAEVHYNLGLALARQGKIDDAITQYQQALQIKPAYAEACNNLGMAFARRGDVDEAITQYQRALAMKPDYAEAHNNLGAALQGRGRTAEAAAQFETALAIEPNYAEAHNNLGAVRGQQGRPIEAIAHLQKALDLDSRHEGAAEAHNNLGSLLGQLGRLSEAIAHFQKALELNPRHEAARRNLGIALRQRDSIPDAPSR